MNKTAQIFEEGATVILELLEGDNNKLSDYELRNIRSDAYLVVQKTTEQIARRETKQIHDDMHTILKSGKRNPKHRDLWIRHSDLLEGHVNVAFMNVLATPEDEYETVNMDGFYKIPSKWEVARRVLDRMVQDQVNTVIVDDVIPGYENEKGGTNV